MTHRAKFPILRTIVEFDFTYPSGPRQEPRGGVSTSTAPREVGKTHGAIAFASKAIQHGSDARFVTTAHLIDELSSASRDGKLREAVVSYTHPGVLVGDKMGHL
ncbi:MAG: ATP-binding protein [Thermoplasmata archaeon]